MAISISPQGASSIQQNLNKSTQSLRKSNEELSSGKRRGLDDVAALAIATQLEAEGRLSSRSSSNINDAVSLANIADGGLSQVSDILTRQGELAAQSANGTLNDEQRASLDQEFQQLSQELTRISDSTTFNGQQLLSGSGNSFDIQVGTGSSSNSQVAISTPGVSSDSLNISSVSIATAAGAQAAIDTVKLAATTVSSARGDIGGQVARLEVAYNQAQTERVNLAAARSQLQDVDVAQAAADRAAANIRQQAGVAIAGQANQAASTVLRLLT